MSIEIATVENALITHTYHLEDWTNVISQIMARELTRQSQ